MNGVIDTAHRINKFSKWPTSRSHIQSAKKCHYSHEFYAYHDLPFAIWCLCTKPVVSFYALAFDAVCAVFSFFERGGTGGLFRWELQHLVMNMARNESNITKIASQLTKSTRIMMCSSYKQMCKYTRANTQFDVVCILFLACVSNDRWQMKITVATLSIWHTKIVHTISHSHLTESERVSA